MCIHSPTLHILFNIPLLAANIFICILEKNLPAVIVTWYGWWRIVLGKMAHFHVCSQRVWRARKSDSHIPSPEEEVVTKLKAWPFTLHEHAQGTWLHSEGNICTAMETTPKKEAFLRTKTKKQKKHALTFFFSRNLWSVSVVFVSAKRIIDVLSRIFGKQRSQIFQEKESSFIVFSPGSFTFL